MNQDKQLPITLQIADDAQDMHVLSFTGHDALNEPYRFEVDLISSNPYLDIKKLAGHTAWLAFGIERAGVHGLIEGVRQIYAGTCLSLYRMTLAPSLMKLEQEPARRLFKGLSVPQLIIQLLKNHGLDEGCYLFEPLIGAYPPRDSCVQYDETDLHLLQRLCEEEGIHFRFEHSPTGHLLVFADDPASFPQRPTAIRFQLDQDTHNQPAIDYLSENLNIHSAIRRHEPARRSSRASVQSQVAAQAQAEDACNQPFVDATDTSRPGQEEAHHRQISARTLERLRCERRHIQGRSHSCALTSGQIIQVLEHPIGLFNDQWLLIKIRHWGKQPEALEGCDPHDMACILGAFQAAVDAEQLSSPVFESFDHGYRNDFCVLPWAMTFRPSCAHPKPEIRGDHHVTLMSDAAGLSSSGSTWRLPIQYDWQIEAYAQGDKTCWSLAVLPYLSDVPISKLATGDRLIVRHFDNDPDLPVICGLLEDENPSTLAEKPAVNILLNGSKISDPQKNIRLSASDRLTFVAREDLRLSSANATFELSSAGISITGPQKLNLRPTNLMRLVPAASKQQLIWEDDLRLTEQPGLTGAALPERIWYIVFMATPGLDHLPRLEPRHFLFEGRTNEQGYLGLTCAQMRDLSARYRRSPAHLCLVHPGCCITLQAWFAQNWSEQRLRAFMEQDQ